MERNERGYIETLNGLFARIGAWSYDHRWIVLLACLLVLGPGIHFAARVRFDNSFEAYFDPHDPAYSAYLEFRDEFGSDEVSYILYEAPGYPHGPWNLEVMRKIEKLTAALEEEVPFVEEATSLVNVEFVDPIPDGIKVHQLLDEFPETQKDLLEIKLKVLRKPLYVGGLASRDGKYAAIVVEMEKSSIDPLEEIKLDPEGGEALANLYPQAAALKIEEILSRPEYQGIVFHHTGDVPLNAAANMVVAGESASLGEICFAIIVMVLLLFFRRFIGVVGPLAVVILATLVTVAFTGVVQWSLDMMFVMLPTLLIAVGVADSVHIISEFRAYHVRLGRRREAVRRTMRVVGTPCLLTSLTTAAGFGAMSVAPIKTIAHFAVYSVVGVMAAFVFSVTLLPVLLSFGRDPAARERAEAEERRASGGRFIDAVLTAVARFDMRHRRLIMAVAAGIVAFSLLGMLRLRVDSNFMNDFSDEVPVQRATVFADAVMGGTNSFVYLLETDAPGGVKEPAVLREIERLQTQANKQTEIVKKTYSIVDLLKDINQTFHAGDPAYYAIPDSRNLVAQYLLLYEMSGGEELRDYVSEDYSRASLDLRCKWADSSRQVRMVKELGAYLAAHPLHAAHASVTGIGALWLELTEYITDSQIRGFLLAFSVIAVMLCLLFRSVATGLLAMVPNLLPVVLTLGSMGWLGVALDYVRLLVAPVAIGIAVDDTIHLVTRYRHEFRLHADYEAALGAAMRDVGRALFITSAVLILGFLVFLLSVMNSLATFGALLGSTILVALVANFFLMPALVLTFRPFGPEGIGHGTRPGQASPVTPASCS